MKLRRSSASGALRALHIVYNRNSDIFSSLVANAGLEMANNVLYLAINAQVRDSCHRLIGSPIEEAPASTHFGAWRPHPRDAIRDDDPMT